MKRVLITGGTRGIGKACARLFDANGYRVAFTYRQNKEAAGAFLEELDGAAAFQADLAEPTAPDRLFECVLSEFGEPDVLVNNAGVALYGLIQDLPQKEIERVMRVNLYAPIRLSQLFCRSMIRKQSGAIINLSSIWGQTGASVETVYSASKAGLIGFTKALAKELAPSKIRVNCVCPGVVDTDMLAGFSGDERDGILEKIPLGRFADPDEIAEAVFYLASDKASYLTGQILSPNGGMLI